MYVSLPYVVSSKRYLTDPLFGAQRPDGRCLNTILGLLKARYRFFLEYTDHGPHHVAGVLRSADELIAPEALQLLTPEDIALLILAAVLHDVGLHLTQDGFRRLAQERRSLNP